MQNNNDIPEWFLLDLPPINLYTANLLMPYYNGVEHYRMTGIIQPTGTKQTTRIHSKVVDLLQTINSEVKRCVAKCELDKSTLTCKGCNRTLDEIKQAGIAAKSANKKGELND